MSYDKYWNLTEKAFEEICDPHFFFESDDHREALDRLLYIVNDRNMNMSLLTGEVGSGKTITKKIFENSLSKDIFEIISFENSSFKFSDILYDIVKRISFLNPDATGIKKIESPIRNDSYQLINIFKEKLDILVYEEKRHLILIFDEAQLMDLEVLDHIKNLTNISSETTNYMTIFLVGQPELREKIRLLKQVDQRIFLRFHLNNLDYTNSVNYIEHRLKVAGKKNGELFSSQAYEMIFRNTCGVPREINRLCKLALTFGIAQNLQMISHKDIEVILDDIKSN